MSDFYWLRPEWKQATCGRCGVNIWNAGGDPDHGLCPACFNQQWAEQHPPEPQQPEPDYEAEHIKALETELAALRHDREQIIRRVAHVAVVYFSNQIDGLDSLEAHEMEQAIIDAAMKEATNETK